MEIFFGKAKPDELLSALSRIVKKENIAIDDDAVQAIADIADGAFRDAVKLLEQVSFIPGKITTEKVMRSIQKSDQPKRVEFLTDVLVDKNQKKAIDHIEAFVKEGSDMKAFLTDCLRDLQNDLLAQIKEEPVKGKKTWDRNDIRQLTKYFLQAFEELRYVTISQLPVELAVLDFIESSSAPLPAEKTDFLSEKNPETKNIPSAASVGQIAEVKKEEKREPNAIIQASDDSSDHLNLEKLTSHWTDFIEALKPYNHSVAGVIRGARPKSVDHQTVVIEAFYKFHQERLSDMRVRDILASVLKQLFGVKVKVEIVLGKK